MRAFTAFALEASFFGVLLFGRQRVRRGSTCSRPRWSRWGRRSRRSGSWSTTAGCRSPVGYVVENGAFVPTDWAKIIFSPVVWVRFPHMLLASYLTGAFCVAATGAWYLLRRKFHAEARIMLRMGLYLAAVLVPVQIFFGHLTGDYVHDYQPAKFAAIEGRWHDEQPAGEVVIAIPDPDAETNHYAIKIPVLGSLIGSMSLTSKEVGLTDFPPQDRPPVLIPFFAFRIMVGCGLVDAGARLARVLSERQAAASSKIGSLLWCIFLSFPLPFIATLTGWFTAEVGRQPWTVYGVLRTADALTPFLTTRAATISLVVFCAVYLSSSLRRLLHLSAAARRARWATRPAPEGRDPQPSDVGRRSTPAWPPSLLGWRIAMILFWAGHSRHQHAALRAARWLRSRRRHPVRPDPRRGETPRR